jgi:aquaporin Z
MHASDASRHRSLGARGFVVTTPRQWRQAPRPGVHVVEWLCEAASTMLLLLGGLSAVCLDFGRGSWVTGHVPSASLRLLLTGALFAGSGSLVAISPIGRRSGAHLNPAVTLAFWITGHVHRHDLAGYWVAQVGGALAGTGLVALLWGGAARSVGDGVNHPGGGLSAPAALGVEFLMTALLLTVILVFVSSRRLMHWTPLATWVVVTLLVWQGATHTGTSLNPARSAAPALVALDFRDLWLYVTAPLLAAAVVGLTVRALPAWRPLTARMFNDARYPTTMGSDVAVGADTALGARPQRARLTRGG